MNEIEQVTEAFERKDYREAARLLKPLLQKSPQDPWVQFYSGRLQELNGKAETAENLYRQVMRNTTIPKLLAQARQGLQRLQTREQELRQQAIAQAKADPDNTGPGVLILESISNEIRQTAAQQFARIMKIDPYNARRLLQSRGWRLYRCGVVGELLVYGEELRQAGIPVFCGSVADLKKIQVFRVNYFTALDGKANVICQNEANQVGSLSFDWSEISGRVEGLLPIFAEVVTYDPRRREKVQWKETTHDYAKVWDLHLPGRNCILRICDLSYEFQQGITLAVAQEKGIQIAQTTNRIQWNHLINLLNQKMPKVKVWSDFTPFAETALEYSDLLQHINPQIGLFREEDSNWDPVFQLYSGLVFLKNTGNAK